MTQYAVYFACPSGISLDIHVTADNPRSARQKAYYQAKHFLEVPKGQRPSLRVEHILEIIKGRIAR
jgi:hypothetical protein